MSTEQEKLGREIINLKQRYSNLSASQRADLVFAWREGRLRLDQLPRGDNWPKNGSHP